MKFEDKNNFIVNYKDPEYFTADVTLFKKYCPASSLHANLTHVNSFTRTKLHGNILSELLDKCSPEIILRNRKSKAKKEENTEDILQTIDEVKALFKDKNINITDFSDESFFNFIGSEKEAVIPFVELMEKIYSLDEKKIIETIDTVEKVKEFLNNKFPEVEYSNEIVELLIGKSEEEIQNYIDFGKVFILQFTQDAKVEITSEEIALKNNNGAEAGKEDSEIVNRSQNIEGSEIQENINVDNLVKESSNTKKKEVNTKNFPE